MQLVIGTLGKECDDALCNEGQSSCRLSWNKDAVCELSLHSRTRSSSSSLTFFDSAGSILITTSTHALFPVLLPSHPVSSAFALKNIPHTSSPIKTISINTPKLRLTESNQTDQMTQCRNRRHSTWLRYSPPLNPLHFRPASTIPHTTPSVQSHMSGWELKQDPRHSSHRAFNASRDFVTNTFRNIRSHNRTPKETEENRTWNLNSEAPRPRHRGNNK